MSALLQYMSDKSCKKEVPDLRAGYQVRVHQKIKEGNKERIQVFGGMVIAVNSGHGVDATFTVRKIAEGIGVERVFPFHSPSIVKIEVQRSHKVRQAKLNYIRDLSGKSLRFQETDLDLKEKSFDVPVEEEQASAPEGEEVASETSEAAAEVPATEEKTKAPVEEETVPVAEAEQPKEESETEEKAEASEEKVEDAPKEEAKADSESEKKE